MTVSPQLGRRTLLGAALAGGLALTGCSGSSGGGSTSQGLRMAWWGNQTRTDLTNQVIAAFQKTGGPAVQGEPAEWASYWDKLATQTAASDAPDLIQMDLKYLRQYGDRGALLDLGQAGVVTTDFAKGTNDSTTTPNGLMGVNAGVNALLVLANKKIFDSLGVDLPDDKTWTWTEWAKLSAEITAKSAAKGGTIIGCSDFTLYDLGIWMWMRQKGKDLYTADGLGFDAADAQEWFEFAVQLEKTKAIPAVGIASDDIVAPVSDRLFTKGQTAMSVYWSNQIVSLEKASGQELTVLRFPSTTGKVADAKLFNNVSMAWSVSAKTKNTESVITFVNFLVNDPAAAEILKAERGMPANTTMRAKILPDLNASDQKAAAYLEAIAPVLAAAPPAPPAGLGDISLPQTRHLQDVRFGRSDAATAAKAYVEELKGLLTS